MQKKSLGIIGMALIILIALSTNITAPSTDINPDAPSRITDTFYKISKTDTNIEIGNNRSGEFEPSARFEKWNGENYLEVKLNETGYSIPRLSGNRLETTKADKDISIYDAGNALKFVFTLKEKPATNTYSFELEEWEEFDFFYQPPLSEEFGEMEEFDVNGETWIRPANYEDLNEYSQRPLKADGSYAVYHKTKRDYVIGSTNYKTGKFLHIYVPKATDAKGVVAWTSLHIENGVYTIAIPQDFLNKAQYPIILNDEFGYHEIGETTGTVSGNYVIASPLDSPTFNGQITHISYYLGADVTEITYGLYNTSGGSPANQSLVVDTGGATPPGVNDWFEQAVDTNEDIYGGTVYIIAQNHSGTAYFYWDSGQTRYYYGSTYTSGSLPATFSGSPTTTVNRAYSAYATYTSSGVISDPNLDVNVSYINGYEDDKALPTFSYLIDGNLTIDFNVATNTNYSIHLADINYSTSNIQGTGTSSINNLLIDGNYCRTNLLRGYTVPGTDSSLIGYWKFDAQEDDYNSIQAFDYSGNGNHGQYVDGADNSTEGKWDTNASMYDGVNDAIVIANPANFPTTAITVMMWVKTGGVGDGVFSYAAGTDNEFLIFGEENLTIYRGGVSVVSGVSFSDSLWHHLAVTWESSDGNTIVYKDGVQVYSDTLTPGSPIDATDGCIVFAQEQDSLCGGFSTSQSMPGRIEEVKIYNVVLTPDQISQDNNYGVKNMRACSYDWNISGIPDNNYYANIRVEDSYGFSDFNSSNNSFRVNPAAGADDCSCPASGHWIIDDASNCTLNTLCNLSGDLHLKDGSLNVATGGTLVVPVGQHITIENTPGERLIIQGGKIVVEK